MESTIINLMNMKYLMYVVAVFLFLGIFELPYNYYVLLRWIVGCSALIVSYKFFSTKINNLGFIYLLIGIIFNPFLPIYLSKSTWLPLDLIE
jgi:hypothetical protein